MCKSKCGRVNQTELNNGQSFHDKIFFDEKVFTKYIDAIGWNSLKKKEKKEKKR